MQSVWTELGRYETRVAYNVTAQPPREVAPMSTRECTRVSVSMSVVVPPVRSVTVHFCTVTRGCDRRR
jgi:hypothetical protein